MSTLKGLSSTARSQVSDDFRYGEVLDLDVSAHVCEIKFNREITVEPLRELITTAMVKFGNDAAKSDSWLGPRVHAAFRLTRREAADKRLWQYLTVVEFAEYVRWRWGNEGHEKAAPLDRFFGEDSKNAISRLWWIPELTRNGPDYSRSVAALEISRFAVSWMQIIVSHHRPCTLAVVDFLKQRQASNSADLDGQKLAKALNAILRTISLDMLTPNPSLDADAIRDWVRDKVDTTLIMDKLPYGPDEAPVSEQDIDTMRQFLEELATRIHLESIPKRPLP